MTEGLSPAFVDELLTRLEGEEGIRLFPYRDSLGVLTIGIGRNLETRGLTAEEARDLCRHDLRDTWAGLLARWPWMAGLDEPRRVVVIDMAFNLGIAGLANFVKFLAALKTGEYAHAADEMLASRWAGQVGQRAARLAALMRTGSR